MHLVLAALLLLMTACSQYKYESVSGDPTKTRIYTLDNGLKVYLSVNEKEPRIQTCIAVRVGGKNDPAETTGLAHYFEHLMFKGTDQFGTIDYEAEKPMLDQIEQLFEVYRATEDESQRAAIYKQIDSISYEASKLAIPNEYDKLMSIIGSTRTNAFTSTDMTVYVENIPTNQIDNWARIQADRFKNPIIRLFHTELETIYEEKNMSLTNDNRKVSFAIDEALYPNHPYGKQTVLGSQEHLKNPSITNVKNYHKSYYVPNNMAICISGDFNPDEAIKIIDKYFGDMQPNPEVPKLEFEPEKPITSPIVKEVVGLEAENISLAWRLPAISDKSSDLAIMADYILGNGTAGLIDTDLLKNQKVLSAYNYTYLRGDYGSLTINARPKQGQTLDEVKDLLLAQVEKLRKGEFDDDLIEATVNNLKLLETQEYEDNYGRALAHVSTFIYGIEWEDQVKQIDRLSKITKQDIMDWANEFMTDENYVAVYKRVGKDESIQKISAPEITPIATNRDERSSYLDEISNTPVKPIEPVFVDYSKDLVQFPAKGETNVLYKQNTTNDLASVTYVFKTGLLSDPALSLALNYLSYLGTATMSAQDFSMEFYKNACQYSTNVNYNTTRIKIGGLAENIGASMALLEDLIENAVPDEQVLANLKDDMLKKRINAKLNQSQCFGALQLYMQYGKEQIAQTTLTDSQLMELTSEELLGKVRNLMQCEHEIFYYGPESKDELEATIAQNHNIPESPEKLQKLYPTFRAQDGKSTVYLAEYDANQIYYLQYSNREEMFDKQEEPYIKMYNDYFSGGMNAIVFQEMREARGLAYTASARLSSPSTLEQPYRYIAFIATQNDKMQQAIEAFESIINDMPISEKSFEIAKEAIITNIRTSRLTGDDILWDYYWSRELGLDEPINKLVYEKAQDMTLDDVAATQAKWVKGRAYDYAILGREKDLDLDYLRSIGDLQKVSLEEIFGY